MSSKNLASYTAADNGAGPPIAAPASGSVPLYVDLDGSLVATDLLLEGIVLLARRSPGRLFRALMTLPRGRAGFKQVVAREVTPDIAHLPYRPEVLSRVRAAGAEGRTVVLATAADEQYARRVAEHVGGFAAVLASDGTTNLKGAAKLAAVQRHADGGPFDFIGDGPADIPLLRAAREGYRVPGPAAPLRGLIRAMRPHQWTKNLLVFVPAILAHEFMDGSVMARAALGFATFCAAASGTYLVNDLLDLEADRAHPRKRSRPLAAGELPLPLGALASLILMTLALGASTALGPAFTLLLLAYVVTAQSYSLVLKGKPVLDVLTLSALYSLRIFAGAVAAAVPVSAWLLAFSSFLFLSLAFVKRYEELLSLGQQATTGPKGRGYEPGDVELIRAFGPAAGYISVLVLALYVYSDQVRALYSRPGTLWLVAPLMLYWITRLWFLAHRGRLGSDPVIFAVRDPVSYLVGAAAAATVLAAGPL